MLHDKPQSADQATPEQEMRAAPAACPRILDLIARGAIADPDAEAIRYLRSPLDQQPLAISYDRLMGAIKEPEIIFRAQDIVKEDAARVLPPTWPAAAAASVAARTLCTTTP